MDYQTITTALDDGVLIITLNRPEKYNAWSYSMHGEMNHAVESANSNKDVDAIVLT